MLKRHQSCASFRTDMVAPCSERGLYTWTDTRCKRKGKKAPLPQPHCREWSSAGAHRCVYWSLSFEPWTSSLGHFKKPSVSRLNSSAAKLNFSTVPVTDRGGLHRQHFFRAKAKASWWQQGGRAAPARHGCLTSSVALHDVAQLRNTTFQTKLYLQAIKTRPGLPLRHSIYEIASLLCRGITGKPSTLWHTEEIRRVPLNPRYSGKSTKPLIFGGHGGPLYGSIL